MWTMHNGDSWTLSIFQSLNENMMTIE